MGSRILAGRYELLEKIGEGGMAVVFRAKDRVLSRYVAVKILRPEYTKDQQFIESFRKESQLAASIVDPNIVNVYDVGREGNIYYIVMELVEGLPLSETIRQEAPLDSRRAVAIARQIAMALSTAHRHNLIHRDVKPHNILLGKGDIAKIADFGIAKVVNNDTLVGDQKEAVMGSIHYFSPEQARGSGVDERSDIYSLGIVLYEMVTGKVPFDGQTAVEVAVKHMNEAITPPSHFNPDIPQDVEDIILKATRKNPDERYNNADEMITDLSFVKYSKVSDYKLELAQRRANGEIDWTVLDEDDEAKLTPSERRNLKRHEKEEKKAKRRAKFPPQRVIAAVIAVALAFPVSSFVYNKLNSKTKKVSDDVSVPNLVNMIYESAEEYIISYDLNIEVGEEVMSEAEIGTIVSQVPEPESVVKRGSSIKVNISKGIQAGSVPNLIGKSQKNAQTIIENYKYSLGKVTTAYSSQIPKGYVISQDPVKDTVLETGAQINIVVSLGDKEEEKAKDTSEKNETDNTADNKNDNAADTAGDSDYMLFVVPSGSTGKKIGEMLEADGLIESTSDFTKALNDMGYGSKLKAGSYKIQKGADMEQIIKILAGEK